MKRGGQFDGSAPGRVAESAIYLQLGPVLYPEIERQLFAVQLSHPRGNEAIWRENDRKWMAVLNEFLIDPKTTRASNGGRNRCSD